MESNKRSLFSVDRIGASLKRKDIQTSFATVHSAEVLADGRTARVIARFGTTFDPRNLQKAVSSAFDGRARAVEGSFRSIPGVTSAKNPVYVGFVVPNRVVQAYVTSQQKAGFVEVATNVLMDEKDSSIWDLKQDEEGTSYIVRQENEDLSSLIEMASVRSVGIPKAGELAAAIVAPGEYVAFVCPETASTRYGFVASVGDTSAQIMSRDTGQLVAVAHELIVDVAENMLVHASNAAEWKVPPAETPLADMSDYYRALYGYDSDFFSQLEEIIRSHGF